MARTWLAGWRPYALLTALCLALYLPGMTAIPVLDRDEARFAQATRQMLETGDFIDIRFRNEERNRKPAGIYWLQAAAVRALSTPESTAIWPYRLPSLIGASLAVLLTFRLARRLLLDDEAAPGDSAARTALTAAVFLATALGVVVEAHIAKTDAALLAVIVAGQGALGLAYTGFRAGKPIGFGIAALFWVAEIVAILLKGPIGIGLAALTAATLSVADRDARWLRGLRPIAGLIVTTLAIAPWLFAIERATEGRFLAASLGQDFLSKVFGAQESHGAPPFYYLVLSLVTFWPASLLLAPTLIHAWQRYEQPLIRFLLAWIVPAWVCIELVPTKLPHYVLPLYPALALLAATAFADGPVAEARWMRWVERGVAVLWIAVSLTVAGGLIVLPLRFDEGMSLAGVAGAAVIVGLGALLLLRRPRGVGLGAAMAALSLVFTIPAAIWVAPGLDRLWLSRGAAAMIARHPPTGATPVVVLGYNEPSLVFLLGGRLAVGTMPSAAGLLEDGGEALVTGREDAQFSQGLAARGLAAQPIDSIRGTDYSNGQRMVMTLYRIVPK